jgi:hypothetical protein
MDLFEFLSISQHSVDDIGGPMKILPLIFGEIIMVDPEFRTIG